MVQHLYLVCPEYLVKYKHLNQINPGQRFSKHFIALLLLEHEHLVACDQSMFKLTYFIIQSSNVSKSVQSRL